MLEIAVFAVFLVSFAVSMHALSKSFAPDTEGEERRDAEVVPEESMVRARGGFPEPDAETEPAVKRAKRAA